MTAPRLWDRELDALMARLDAEGQRPRLLLHVCCAPCATAVIERLQQTFDLFLYFDNPNIDTLSEFSRRAEALSQLAGQKGLSKNLDIVPYAPLLWQTAIQGLEDEPEGGRRCAVCFDLRLRQAAQAAKTGGFDYFACTLTLSPHKDAALINSLGEQIAADVGVRYLASDFKKKGGMLRSSQISRALGLYRQNYCGCRYSKKTPPDGRTTP